MATINPTPTQSTATPNPTSAAPAATPVITSPSDRSTANTKLHVEARDQTLINGILANLGDVATFALPTGTYTRDELVAAFKDRIAASEATKTSSKGWHSTVQAERQAERDIDALRKGIKQFVAGRYGADSVKMAEFGFTPAKTRKTTVRAKATALEKSAATRVARHTMGRVQKQTIHGEPAAVQPAPGVTPAANPAPAATTTALPAK